MTCATLYREETINLHGMEFLELGISYLRLANLIRPSHIFIGHCNAMLKISYHYAISIGETLNNPFVLT